MSDQPPVFLPPGARSLVLIQQRKSQVTIKSGLTLIKYLQTHSYAASESSSIIACHAATFLSPDTKHISLSLPPAAWIGVNEVLHFSIISWDQGMYRGEDWTLLPTPV